MFKHKMKSQVWASTTENTLSFWCVCVCEVGGGLGGGGVGLGLGWCDCLVDLALLISKHNQGLSMK